MIRASLRRVVNGHAGLVAAFVLGLVVATTATAGAVSLITGKQIKDGSISQKDLSKALQAQISKTGAAGAAGEPGPRGDRGEPGSSGAAGATSVVTRQGGNVDLTTGQSGTSVAECQAGETVTGGGYRIVDGSVSTGGYRIINDRPVLRATTPPHDWVPASEGDRATGWSVSVVSDSTAPLPIGAYVQCAAP